MKNVILLLGLLLCLCASSWGACESGNFSCDYGLSKATQFNCVGNCGGSSVDPSDYINNCPSTCGKVTGFSFSNSYDAMCKNAYCPTTYLVRCNYTTRCDTQAEADSVAIAQKCATGVMAKDTANGNIFDVCKNGEGLLITFNNPITGVRDSSIGYYIVTDNSADLLEEATYNHLAALACTEVSLYRGVLNGKYVYWYSTDPEPAGVVNVVRIK